MKAAQIIQANLIGIFLSFMLICVFWTGIFANYINYYGIREFVNPFLYNVFSPLLFVVFALLFGFGFLIPVIGGVLKILYALSLIASLSLFIPAIGKSVGQTILSKQIEIPIDGKNTRIYALYENRFYIFYLAQDAPKDAPTLEERRENLRFYEKP